MPESSSGESVLALLIAGCILVAVALAIIPVWARAQLHAKNSEATRYLHQIRAQELAMAESVGLYSGAATAPATVPSNVPMAWPDTSDFDLLGFNPQGKVYFAYHVSGPVARVLPNGEFSEGVKPSERAIDLFLVAVGDLDGDGKRSRYWVTDEVEAAEQLPLSSWSW